LQESNIVYRGSRYQIEWAVTLNEQMPAADFFQELSDRDQAKMLALFRLIGETGRIHSSEHFRKVKGSKFFEFKHFQIRMLCFFTREKSIVITSGFRKKQNKIPNKEIARANKIMREHLQKGGD
jgi:hypothetical protein